MGAARAAAAPPDEPWMSSELCRVDGCELGADDAGSGAVETEMDGVRESGGGVGDGMVELESVARGA